MDGLRDYAETDKAQSERRRAFRLRPRDTRYCARVPQAAGRFALQKQEVKGAISRPSAQSMARKADVAGTTVRRFFADARVIEAGLILADA
jgi:hypothetical protein